MRLCPSGPQLTMVIRDAYSLHMHSGRQSIYYIDRIRVFQITLRVATDILKK
jgi:hypothetical protein